MEDRRAHERINNLETLLQQTITDLKQHAEDVVRIEQSVIENTKLAKSIEQNTSEIVDIMRGGKVLVAMLILLAKVGAAIGVLYGLWHALIDYIRG